ncbi:MAG: DUF222 domain-containing protein [Steroidobacteraceae bacterium]
MDDLIGRAPQGLSTPDLASAITELTGHLNAATHRWLHLVAEFDRRQGWSDGVTRSCAHWLGWQCGIDLCAAREKVRVARALESLPLIDAAMGRGELSYSKVRALTRVATPATEPVLLNIALHGTVHHVETLVRQFRRVQEVEALSREARQHAGRSLSYFHDDDGSLVIKARLPAEAGAQLLKALEAAIADAPLPEHFQGALNDSRESSSTYIAEDPPSPSMRRADALALLAESFLQHGAQAMPGGDRHQIVVHVDHDTLRSAAPGRCELDDGPSLAVETARRLACDSSVVRIVEHADGEPLDVGRKTRSIPPALRRALKSRDQGCVFPGCTHKRHVDGHHIEHWADGGATRLSDLVALCRFHHRAVHEGGIRIERLDDGAWRFVLPNGESRLSCAPGRTLPMGSGTRLTEIHRDAGLRIDAGTAATRWRGERMDHEQAIDSLLFRSRAAPAAPLATS